MFFEDTKVSARFFAMLSASDASNPEITEVLAFEIFIWLAADVIVLDKELDKEPKADAPPESNPETASVTPDNILEMYVVAVPAMLPITEPMEDTALLIPLEIAEVNVEIPEPMELAIPERSVVPPRARLDAFDLLNAEVKLSSKVLGAFEIVSAKELIPELSKKLEICPYTEPTNDEMTSDDADLSFDMKLSTKFPDSPLSTSISK